MAVEHGFANLELYGGILAARLLLHNRLHAVEYEPVELLLLFGQFLVYGAEGDYRVVVDGRVVLAPAVTGRVGKYRLDMSTELFGQM